MTTREIEALFLLKAVGGEQQLPIDRELLMGRDASSDVVLDKGQASRKHAKLIPDAEGVWVEDLGSTNGTFVSGERISKTTLLRTGDELRCGESVFELVAKSSPVAEDPDATLLYSADAEPALPGDAAKPAQEQVEKSAPAPEASASKAPPSWVLNNQQSVDGTAFISKDALKNSLLSSGHKAEAQETVSEPTLVGNSDPVTGLRFQLIGEGKNKWEIGRSPNADIMLNDDSVSGAHAQILHEGGRWKLVDLMSANGTYVNGKKCLTGYLASGDLVGFGGVECAFMLPESEQEPPAAESASTGEARSAALDSSALKTAAIAFVATAAVALGVIFLIGQFL